MDKIEKPPIIILRGKEINRNNIMSLIEAGKQFDIYFDRKEVNIFENVEVENFV